VETHGFRYLRGTVGYGLKYASSVDLSLQGYADANWAGIVVAQKRTYGCFFTLGSSMFSWFNRKYNYVALSTSEEEYVALSVAFCEVVWLCKLMTYLFYHEMDPTTIHFDKQSCVKLS
jgi:hypothetical protein